MGYLATSFVLCSFFLFSALASRSCWTQRTEDIDWDRVSSSWWDVIDVPLPITPTGCWKPNNLTVRGGDVLWQFEMYNPGETKASGTTQYLFYGRKSPGVYTLNNNDAKSLFETLHHFVEKSIPGEDEENHIEEVIIDYETHEWTFLTDYDTYLMFIFCGESGWNAYVKASTPHISSGTLRKISQALVDNGLQSPTMTLKNGCLDTGDANWNKADVVIV